MTWARDLTLAMLTLYQRYVSPMLPPACRFEPSCSRYSYEAVARYGFIKGTRLTAARLLRCHPLHRGGFDPVK
jgi:uncharacterized protein